MSLKEMYKAEIASKLQKELALKNPMAVPTLEKVTVAVGISPSKHKDGKFMETAEEVLTRITGQKPVRTLARKSISNFKIREGQPIGLMVTLRGKQMWDFVDKLVNFTFPRVRDFRGIPESVVDRSGHMSLGFTEHLAFPEIRPDEVERVHGLEVTLTSTATTKEQGLVLYRLLGFPFIRQGSK